MAGLQSRFDPFRMFQPAMYTRVTATTPAIAYLPGCDLRKECYCTEDSHCSPLAHACTASLAFPEYKVCKPKPEYDTTVASIAGLFSVLAGVLAKLLAGK